MFPSSLPLQPLSWQLGTVERIIPETHRVKSFALRLPQWRPFKPGQHVDVRLTAPDGYQAQRSYSIASSPEQEGVLELTIELIEDGEVSPYFHEVVEPGDQIEIRGPIGGPFTWGAAMGGPLLLVAGGSGVVPLMSMLRHRAATGRGVPAVLLYSSRAYEDIIYRRELERMVGADAGLNVWHTLTRTQPAGWTGYRRRIDQDMLLEALGQVGAAPHTYVCGPTAFVEVVADGLVAAGVPPERVRTERFGPSGT
jgi:ferredoxin-NADP reductase